MLKPTKELKMIEEKKILEIHEKVKAIILKV